MTDDDRAQLPGARHTPKADCTGQDFASRCECEENESDYSGEGAQLASFAIRSNLDTSRRLLDEYLGPGVHEVVMTHQRSP
jgi:hypothetical protein